MDTDHSVYFDADSLPDPKNQYVCWIDIMGVQSKLLESMPQCANALYKFHETLCEVEVWDKLETYPLMDGVYVMADRRDQMEKFLNQSFTNLAKLVNQECLTGEQDDLATEKIKHAIIPRAGLAFGPILHSKDFSEEVSEIFSDYHNHMSEIPMGMPMVQANQYETKAPPFGTYVHESARGFSPLKEESLPDRDGSPEDLADDESPYVNRLRYVWHDWTLSLASEDYDEKLLQGLAKILEDYFLYSLKNHHHIPHYSPEKILQHAQQTAQYFDEFDYEKITDAGRTWS